MRWQLLLLLGVAAVSLAYGAEDTNDDSVESLNDLVDDNGRFRSSAALELVKENKGIGGGKRKLPLPVVALAAAGTLAKVILLVLVGTGTIPTTIGTTTIPEPIVGIANTTAAVVTDLLGMLAGGDTETAIVELNTDLTASGITGEIFFAQTSGVGGAGGKTIITGTLRGLTADESYTLDVTTYGDLINDCDEAGDSFLENGSGTFVADSTGRALIILQVENAPITGSDTVLGRSIVIMTQADPPERVACGTIVRG